MRKSSKETLADETNQLVHKIVNEGIDAIVGGFPCQDISFAGLGAGISGERSGLWKKFFRTIRLVRPKIALLENVAALLDRGMGEVLGDLAKIGYDAEWHCIQADAVGLPQERKRIYALTYPHGERGEGRWPKEIQGGGAEYRGAKMSEGLRTCLNDPIYTHPNFAEAAMGLPKDWTLLETETRHK